MKKTFQYFYDIEFPEDDFWKNCQFSFDANVLLNLYSLSPANRTSFFKLLTAIEKRIFLTHHAALEYHRRIDDRTKEQLVIYKKNMIIGDLLKRKKELEAISNHPFCDFKEIADSLEEQITKLKSLYEKAEKKQKEYRESVKELQNEIAAMFEEKVGHAFTNEQLMSTINLADLRRQLSLPPGFEDHAKQTNSAGDSIIWFQLFDMLRSKQSRQLAFITDDLKPDWWKNQKPHPELLMEMKQEGIEFFMLNSQSFMRKIPKILSIEVDFQAIEMAADELNQIALEALRRAEDVDPLSMAYVLKTLGTGVDLFWESDKLSRPQCLAIKSAFLVSLRLLCESHGSSLNSAEEILDFIEVQKILPPKAHTTLCKAFKTLDTGAEEENVYKSDAYLDGADKILAILNRERQSKSQNIE